MRLACEVLKVSFDLAGKDARPTLLAILDDGGGWDLAGKDACPTLLANLDDGGGWDLAGRDACPTLTPLDFPPPPPPLSRAEDVFS
jgi:hypothetical protein